MADTETAKQPAATVVIRDDANDETHLMADTEDGLRCSLCGAGIADIQDARDSEPGP